MRVCLRRFSYPLAIRAKRSEEMISGTLQGGLGNCLHQIAAIYGTAKKNNTSYCIPQWNDLAFFRGNFNICNDVSIHQYTEKGFHYQDITGTDLHLFGYFQSWKYWQHCEADIREMFQPCDSIKKWLDKEYGFLDYDEDSCCIHVRGSDYLKLKDYHYNLEADYYQSAADIMGQKNFYIFTDDLPHAKTIFGENENYVQTGKAHLDFFLMQRFKSFIIANSSFSWWASVLSQSKNVIAPKTWFGKLKQDLITSDLYTKEMRVI